MRRQLGLPWPVVFAETCHAASALAAVLVLVGCAASPRHERSATRESVLDRAATAARIEGRLASERTWNEQYAPLRKRQRAGDDVEAQIQSLGPPPQFADLEADALSVIDADPTDDVAFEAIEVVLRNNRMPAAHDSEWGASESGKLNTRMGQLLLAYHLNRPQVADAAYSVSFSDPAQLIDYWQRIFTSSTVHAVRGQAAEMLMQANFNRSIAVGLADSDREVPRQDALHYAQLIRGEYADVDSLRARSDKVLTALEHSSGVKLRDAEVATVSGGVDSLKRYEGKVVLLEFWATWCTWCRKGQPELKTLREDMAGKPFEIISVSVDDTPELVTRYMHDEYALPWPQWYVGPHGPLLREWGVQGYPTYLLLDARGVVQARTTGSFEFGALKERVRQLVAEIEH